LSKAALSSSFEEHNEALAISRGSQCLASAGLQDLLGRISQEFHFRMAALVAATEELH
jgi:hypothetical protein